MKGPRLSVGAIPRRLIIGVLAAVVLVTVPLLAFANNSASSSNTQHDRPTFIGLGSPAGSPAVSPALSSARTPSATPGMPSPSPSPSPSATAAPTASPSPRPLDPHPWLAWRPSGIGQVVDATFAGPWTQGSATTWVTIYTPPGYSTKSSRRYPVLYEAPYAYSHWNRAANLSNQLDALIDSGQMPPAIVVAMTTAGGPYATSECTNSYDRREWFDTYVAQTVVPWVDSHYRTIVESRARAVFGASQGGYCAAALAARHPHLFGTSLVYSGYFHAGGVGPPSTLPFGTDQSFIDAASPDALIFDMTRVTRANLYYILVAKSSQPLYGEEAVRFDKLLTQAGMTHKFIESAVPHGWAQVRAEFAAGMEAWAARMVSQGVF